MPYNKVIKYGEYLEIYQYERSVQAIGRKKSGIKKRNVRPVISDDRENVQGQKKSTGFQQQKNFRHALLSFRRIIASNLGEHDVPLLFSLTYAENFKDHGGARKHFKAFVRTLGIRFGQKNIRYVCVTEFQKRGAIHFHALIWGIPFELVDQERSTRYLASAWGHGFLDVIKTDGNIKLAHYLKKYFSKSFNDRRLQGKKLYTTSRNIKRPVIDKNAILAMYNTPNSDTDLSDYQSLQERIYDTQWLGKGRYRLLEKINKKNEQSNHNKKR